jgi:hypothetical protein
MGSLSRASGITIPRLQPGDTWQAAYQRLAAAVEHLIRDDELPRRWNDLSSSVGVVKFGGASDPSWVAYKGGYVLSFQDARSDVAYFNVQLSHQVDEAGPLEFHVHVIPTNNNAGNVRWQLTYSWAGIGGVFPAATTVTADCAIAANSLDKHIIHEVAATIAPPSDNTVSAGLSCSVTRLGSNAADTYVGDAYVIFFDFHEPRNTNRGSQLERAKWDR